MYRFSLPRRALLLAGFAACTLSGCGGDQTASVTSMPSDPHLEVRATACDVRSYDSGYVLYVIRSRDCAAMGAASSTLIERAAVSSTQEVSLVAGGAPAVVAFRELGNREVNALQEGHWREIPNPASWAPRDGAGLLIKDGLAYLLGGWVYGPLSNEVWVSRNLVDWQFLGFAPWTGRHGAGWVVHNERLYVISGEMLDDVWSSQDGVNWRQEAAHAPFGKRYTPNVASHDGSLFLYGGLRWLPNDYCTRGQLDCTVEGFNDVWRSDDGGQSWTQIQADSPWAGRGLIHGQIVHQGEIFILGGGLKVVPPGAGWAETSAEFADAWSSRDGREWTRRIETLPFAPRTHLSVAATSYGCVVSDGSVGTQENVSNELFLARDCLNYQPVQNPPLPARHASSLVEFNGTLVILGGPPTDNPGTAIWQYVP